MTFTRGNGPARLASDVTREDVSAECRDAALELMAGSAHGWDKLDLVLWLTGAYHRATRHVLRGERVANINDGDDIQEETLELIVARVRQQILASLEKAALEDGTLDFAEDAVARGIVQKAITEDGEEVWVPVDASRMRLRDRVRSLFVADYLNAPESYAELFVCHRCEAIVFDAGAKDLGVCAAHKRLSGVVPRDDAETARVVGEDD
jgi:hypothetical protein